ncbi:hypothetical protein [Undibacterium sp. TJN19]|uniref:hypothetical protein n=1 Tax=Undibacterium sp. TJN19 TaxID=3413055 RepID=UPI003BF21D21
MNKDIAILWTNAGKLLAENTSSIVLCPVCAKENLQVKDIRSVENPFVVERVMSCPSCEEKNYLRLIRPLN